MLVRSITETDFYTNIALDIYLSIVDVIDLASLLLLLWEVLFIFLQANLSSHRLLRFLQTSYKLEHKDVLCISQTLLPSEGRTFLL